MTRFALRAGPRVIELNPGIAYLGRSIECLVRLDEGLISRRHARLDVEPEALFIEDLGSLNGTLLNRRLVRGREQLQVGDVIQIGNSEMRVEAGTVRRAASVGVPVQGSSGPVEGSGPPEMDEDDQEFTDPSVMPATGAATPSSSRLAPLLLEVARKALALGRLDEARRVTTSLHGALQRGTEVQGIGHATLRATLNLTLELTAASSDATLVSELLDVCALRGWWLDQGAVEKLATLAAQLPAVAGAGLASYLQAFRAAGTTEQAGTLPRLVELVGQR